MNKTNLAMLFVILAVLAGGAALIFWPSSKPDYGRASINQESTDQASQATTNTPNSNLGVTQKATDLGQLDQGQKQGQSGDKSSTSIDDPSTFKQYDKYQKSSGALFADIQAGQGKALTAKHKATVIYKGWLTDGTLFDSSRTDSNGKVQAFSFVMGDHQVIAGWEQAMYNMKPGGVRLLIVPPAVGYGSQGQGPVPPDAVMVFEVRLISVD